MHLEHLPATSDRPPVLLFHGTDAAEARALFEVFRTLAISPGMSTRLFGLPYIDPVDDCRITALSAEKDLGVVPKERENAFKWTLKPAAWAEVAARLEPFCTESATGEATLAEGPGLTVKYKASTMTGTQEGLTPLLQNPDATASSIADIQKSLPAGTYTIHALTLSPTEKDGPSQGCVRMQVATPDGRDLRILFEGVRNVVFRTGPYSRIQVAGLVVDDVSQRGSDVRYRVASEDQDAVFSLQCVRFEIEGA